jgi:hypothetical protein
MSSLTNSKNDTFSPFVFFGDGGGGSGGGGGDLDFCLPFFVPINLLQHETRTENAHLVGITNTHFSVFLFSVSISEKIFVSLIKAILHCV